MKILKIVLIVLVSLVGLFLLVAFFTPRTYTVSVSETIQRPRTEVYDYMRILNNQKNYSIWVMADPNLNPQITGTDGTVGATQSWNSKNDKVGEGEQKITALTPDSMAVDLHFIRPFEGRAKATNYFKSLADSSTQVTAIFYGNAPYPINLPSYFFGRKMIAEAQTKNLNNLKRILEGK